MIVEEKDYKIKGYKTVFKNKKEGTEKPELLHFVEKPKMEKVI